MKVLVCGGRDYWNHDRVGVILSPLGITTLIEGGASGADACALGWAQAMGVAAKTYPAKWDEHGRSAGPRRNAFMLADNPDLDLVVCFPGGRGTDDMMTKALRAGVPVMIVS